MRFFDLELANDRDHLTSSEKTWGYIRSRTIGGKSDLASRASGFKKSYASDQGSGERAPRLDERQRVVACDVSYKHEVGMRSCVFIHRRGLCAVRRLMSKPQTAPLKLASTDTPTAPHGPDHANRAISRVKGWKVLPNL